MYVVMSKWVEVERPFGTTREPAFYDAGVTSWRDVTAQAAESIAAAGLLVAEVECDETTATKIESQGLGRVLWMAKDAGKVLGADADAVVAKLTAYGVPAAGLAKVTALKTAATCEKDLKDWINGKIEGGGGAVIKGGGK